MKFVIFFCQFHFIFEDYHFYQYVLIKVLFAACHTSTNDELAIRLLHIILIIVIIIITNVNILGWYYHCHQWMFWHANAN